MKKLSWSWAEALPLIVTWSMSWGLLLVLTVISVYKPAQQSFLDFVEKNQLENRPFIVFVALVIWGVIFSGAQIWQQQLQGKKRRNAYQHWANSHRWSYSPEENKDLWRCYRFLYGMPGYAVQSSSNQKRYPCLIHVLEGQWQNYEARAFTYYSRSVRRVQSGKSRHTKVSHYYLGMTLLRVNEHFPKFYLKPLHWSDHLAKFLGLKTTTPDTPDNMLQKVVKIKDQTQQAQQTYQIVTADLTFADQLLDAAVVDCLFQQRKICFEIDRDVLVIYEAGALKPEAIESNLEFLHQIYQQIPAQWKR